MSILVCGGAGYIGSHMAAYLKEQGEEVIILDSMQKGHKEAVEAVGSRLYVGDLRNRKILDKVFTRII